MTGDQWDILARTRRIAEVERRVLLLDTQARNAQRQVIALGQGVWDAWSDLAAPIVPTPTPTPTPPPTPNTGVTGTLFGCTTSGIPGTIVVADASTGTVYLSTATTTGGAWSGTFYLAVNTSVIITATPSSSRVVATSITRTLTAGATNPSLNLSATPASGYTCSKVCPLPIPTTLTLTSTGTCAGNSFPSDTLFFSASPAPGWYGTATFNLTIGGITTYKYQFTINSLGNLGLGAVAQGPGVSVFLATPLLTACVPFSCFTSCPAQGIGCTIHE